MKYSPIFLASSLLTLSLSAQAERISLEDLELNEREEFVSCRLKDGRELSATPWLVSVGHRILAKTIPTAYRTETAETLEFEDWEFKVTVYKQFCGREGYMGAQVTNLRSRRTEALHCRERNHC